MPSQLTIIRHAPTAYNKNNIFMGTKDVPADHIDEKKIQQIRNALCKERFSNIYSSPLKRALETAGKIADGQYDIIIDKRLTERNLGDWQGMSKSDVQKKYADAFRDTIMDFYYTPHNGEHYEDLVKRVSDFLIDRYQDHENSIVVTHNGVFRVMKSLLTGERLSNVFAGYEPFLTPQTFVISESLFQTIRVNPFYTVDQ